MGTKHHKNESSPIIDQLVRQLHQLPGYSIKKIIKGGSLGKGTAMKNGSDIDLIVFFNRYRSIEDFIFHKDQIILDILNYFNNRHIHQFKYMSIVRYDEYLLKYEIKQLETNRSFQVDIVPAREDDRYSSDDLISVYKEMESKPQHIRNHYSACFAKVQRDMVHKRKNVHDLIILLKKWKQEFGVPIKSYCCEVIGLFVHYTYFDEAKSFNVDAAFLEAMGLLSDYKNLQIVLPFYYEINRWKRHFPDKPYILDPVNPFSDTTDRSLNQYGKDKIENCAEQTFNKLKSVGGYQPVSTRLKDKPKIKLLQTKNERLQEEGGLAANRKKSSYCCSIKCLILIIGPIVLVVVAIVYYVYYMFYRQG